MELFVQNVFQEDQICIATVDPVSGKNMIIWDKTAGKGTASYNIYKEVMTDIYNWIGNVAYDSANLFIDYSSQPDMYANRYKISAIDSCGNESERSYYHETINLQISQGVPSTTFNLSWDHYVEESGAFVVDQYYIYRGVTRTNLQLHDSISGSNTSYNDVNITQAYYYAIGVQKPSPCLVDRGDLKNSTFYTGALSNVESNGIANELKEAKEVQFSLYPNPASSHVTFSFANSSTSSYRLQIKDVTGKVVRTKDRLKKNPIQISVEGLTPGVYLLEVMGEKIHTSKLIIK